MSNTLTPSNATLIRNGKGEANIQKIIWPGSKSKWGQRAKFGTKEQNSSIAFTFPSRRHSHCPQNCKKEISDLPPKSVTKPIEGNASYGSVGWDFSRSNIRRWEPAALPKMATAGRICNASRGITSIWDGREWPVRKAAPGRSWSSNLSSSDPSLHQKMSPCPVLYGPILGA